jgi:dynamin 1-like protein
MTKIATDGQPLSIVRELEDMTRHYIKGDNVIILAVSPANADIATSEAMRMVKEYDPEGLRTVGVVTKLDLMDAGTDARELLANEAVFLQNGWFGVVNRSQADINRRVNSVEARRKEAEWCAASAPAPAAPLGATAAATTCPDSDPPPLPPARWRPGSRPRRSTLA